MSGLTNSVKTHGKWLMVLTIVMIIVIIIIIPKMKTYTELHRFTAENRIRIITLERGGNEYWLKEE